MLFTLLTKYWRTSILCSLFSNIFKNNNPWTVITTTSIAYFKFTIIKTSNSFTKFHVCEYWTAIFLLQYIFGLMYFAGQHAILLGIWEPYYREIWCLPILVGTHAGLIYRGQLFIRTVLTKRDSEGDEVAIKTLQGKQMLMISHNKH